MDTSDLSDADAERISKQTDVPTSDVKHMNSRLGSRDMSLNAPVSQDDETATFQDTLVSDGPSPEVAYGENEEFSYRHTILQRALAELPDREREILVERRLKDDPITLEELGGLYGISRERVRQLEVRAFEKIKQFIHASAEKDDVAHAVS